jgi:hypothetical protein
LATVGGCTPLAWLVRPRGGGGGVSEACGVARGLRSRLRASTMAARYLFARIPETSDAPGLCVCNIGACATAHALTPYVRVGADCYYLLRSD